MKINMELRGSGESNFILRHSYSNKTYLFIIEDFYLSVLRLRPVEKIRTNIHRILNGKIQYPILNIKSIEHCLIRGSTNYEIDNIFSCEAHLPLHFFVCLQPESVWTTKLNKSSTNPYRFTTCGLSEFSFRLGDYKLPSALFSSSGKFAKMPL